MKHWHKCKRWEKVGVACPLHGDEHDEIEDDDDDDDDDPDIRFVAPPEKKRKPPKSTPGEEAIKIAEEIIRDTKGFVEAVSPERKKVKPGGAKPLYEPPDWRPEVDLPPWRPPVKEGVPPPPRVFADWPEAVKWGPEFAWDEGSVFNQAVKMMMEVVPASAIPMLMQSGQFEPARLVKMLLGEDPILRKVMGKVERTVAQGFVRPKETFGKLLGGAPQPFGVPGRPGPSAKKTATDLAKPEPRPIRTTKGEEDGPGLPWWLLPYSVGLQKPVGGIVRPGGYYTNWSEKIRGLAQGGGFGFD